MTSERQQFVVQIVVGLPSAVVTLVLMAPHHLAGIFDWAIAWVVAILAFMVSVWTTMVVLHSIHLVLTRCIGGSSESPTSQQVFGASIVLVVFASVSFAMFTIVWEMHSRSKRFGHFIDAAYAKELTAIDNASQKPEKDDFEAFEGLKSDLERTFDSPTLFSVSVEFAGGNHLSKSLKVMPEGYREEFSVSARAGKNSSVYFGHSLGGEPLVIYRLRTPTSRVFHAFRLVFRRDALEKEMADPREG